MWARIALSLSVAGTFVFIAARNPPIVSDSHLFGVSPEEYKIWIFWEILPELLLYSALSGSTADTCGASVYGVFHILRDLVDYGSSGRFSTCSFSAFAWFHSEFSRHQGGEGVAGTPGACSKVFCHPIRCIVGTRQDRLAVL